ncbi:MAG: hypothetical protein IKU27_02615, partial [Clostridia bacterium]|nr:hypothetical protein [Clostridia bacterium]
GGAPIEAIGHDMQLTSAKVEATCENNGKEAVYTCANNCGHTTGGAPIEAIGHDYDNGVVTTQPTCEAPGVKTFTCRNDSKHTYTEAVDMLGHKWDNGTVAHAATCTEDGEMLYTCLNNSLHTRTAPIAANGHKDENPADYKCDVCGTNLCANHSAQTVPGYAATCETDGLTDGSKCSKCGEILTAQQPIEALGHDYNEGIVTTQPGCETPGVKTFTCRNDGKHTYTEDVAPIGHSYQSVVTAPTCTAEGYTTYTCGNCGDSYEADRKPASGHTYWTQFSWQTDFSGAAATAVCDGCNDTQQLTCTVTGAWDQINGKMKFTAKAVVDGETVTDVQYIHLLVSDNTLIIVNSAAQAEESVEMVIMVAGYTNGKMNGCLVEKDITGITEIGLTVSGDLQVFFLHPDTYAPLF